MKNNFSAIHTYIILSFIRLPIAVMLYV